LKWICLVDSMLHLRSEHVSLVYESMSSQLWGSWLRGNIPAILPTHSNLFKIQGKPDIADRSFVWLVGLDSCRKRDRCTNRWSNACSRALTFVHRLFCCIREVRPSALRDLDKLRTLASRDYALTPREFPPVTTA
jgi:hypothetical protein